MSDWVLQRPWMLLLLVVLPCMAWLFQYANRCRKKQLSSLGVAVNPIQRERAIRQALVLLAAGFVVVALARPGCDPRPLSAEEGGRDVVFVLDVSRSMLAGDMAPSRLERARQDLRDCLQTLRGERVGLVAFAGSAAIHCPLTTDYEYLRYALDRLSPDSVAHGSTYLQSAFDKVAARVLAEGRAGYQDVVLLTDGEDQGSHPVEAVQSLMEKQARLMVVGYGDPLTGARIPLEKADGLRFMEHEGAEIWSRLQEESLIALSRAAQPDGRYLRAGDAGFQLGPAYGEWSESAPRMTRATEGRVVYTELYPWFLVPALILLVMPLRGSRPVAQATAGVMVLFGLAAFMPVAARAGDLTDEAAPDPVEQRCAVIAEEPDPGQRARLRMHQGWAWFRDTQYGPARHIWRQAEEDWPAGPDPAPCILHQALAEAELAMLAESPAEKFLGFNAALGSMRRAALMRPDWVAAQQGVEYLTQQVEEARKEFEEEESPQDATSPDARPAFDESAFDEDFEYEEWSEGMEGSMDKSLPGGEAFRSDLVNRALPRPDFSVEEILIEEAMNQETRAQKRGSRVEGAEKDW